MSDEEILIDELTGMALPPKGPVGPVYMTDFERVFHLIKECKSVYTLTDEAGHWHRMTVTVSPTNAGRCLLDGKSFLFTPDGVLAGEGPTMKGDA